MRPISGGYSQQQLDFGGNEYSIWPSSESPGDVYPETIGDLEPSTAPVVVGTKFRFLGEPWQSTSVLGIRWFRTDGYVGVSDVAIWQGTTNLASATVTGETSDGWQRQDFEFPVFIDHNVTHIASALYTEGAYRVTPELLLSAIFVTVSEISSLEVLANSESTNGVYANSSTMVVPTTSAEGTCFYIDIIITG